MTVTGSNLTGASRVTFGGVAGTGTTVLSASQLRVKTPAHAVGTVNVQVTTPGGTSALITAGRFTYASSPAVRSLSPASGPTAGGTTVTVTGSNLTGASRVTFGGVAGTGTTVLSASQLRVKTPAHAVGTVNVQVTTPGGTSTAEVGNRYTYNAPTPEPVIGLNASSGPTAITLNWTNPDDPDFRGVTIRRSAGVAPPISPTTEPLLPTP